MMVSVVMPTYNREKYIKKAIDSVLTQSWSGELELIIVDDCSTDNTQHVVESFCDARISYIKNVTNLGGGGARNVGARTAKGAYLAFIDSDVVWYPYKLARQIELLNIYPSVAVVFCAFRKQVNDGWNIEPDITPSGMVFEKLLFDNFVDTPAAIVRRDAFWSVNGFDERLPRFQDWDLFLRLSNKFKFIGMDEVLFDSFTIPGAISSNDEARLHALKIIFDKFTNEIKSSCKLYHRFTLKFVNAYLILNLPNEAIQHIKKENPAGSVFYIVMIRIFSFLPKSTYGKLKKLKQNYYLFKTR